MDKPNKRRKSHEAFKAEALLIARESRSAQDAARASNLLPKLLYEWLKATYTHVVNLLCRTLSVAPSATMPGANDCTSRWANLLRQIGERL